MKLLQVPERTMFLQGKSVQKKISKTDGIRICIMRTPEEGSEWDLWIPKLSPPLPLLMAYKNEGMTWENFQKEFQKQVIKKQGKLLKMVVELAEKTPVTLLCIEEKGDFCHRSLVLAACHKLSPDLKIKLG